MVNLDFRLYDRSLTSITRAAIDIIKGRKSIASVVEDYFSEEHVKRFAWKILVLLVKNYNFVSYIDKTVDSSQNLIELNTRKGNFRTLILLIYLLEENLETSPPTTFNDQLVKARVKILGKNLELPNSINQKVEAILDGSILSRIRKLGPIPRLSILYSHPSEMVAELHELLGKRVERVLREHQLNRSLFIHARDDEALNCLLRYLQSKKFTYQMERGNNLLVHVANQPGWKGSIVDFINHNNGLLMQDLGSVAVIGALDVQKGDLILDACAAPFQKTIAMAWRTGNSGRLLAIDTSFTRIRENLPRVIKNNIKNLYAINADASLLPLRSKKKFNKILVDAPCTGSGSIISYPELRFLQVDREIPFFSSIQARILEEVLGFIEDNVWDKTTVVYSTCSYYPQEGEAVIESFKNKIILEDIHETIEWLRLYPFGWKGYGCSRYAIRTFPDMQNGCKAFFISRFSVIKPIRKA